MPKFATRLTTMKYITGLILLTAMACSSSENEKLTAAPESAATTMTLDLQGHRGCRGIMPENTIPAMLKALQLGVSTLEMDVVITADTVCLISHEPFFSHEITTLPDGGLVTEENERELNIYHMSFAETQTYDVGLKPHPRFAEQQKMAVTKPSLEQVFVAVNNWCDSAKQALPYFNIETKTTPAGDGVFHPEPEEFVEILMRIIVKHNMQDKVIIQSFDFRTLQYVHEHYPLIQTAALIEDFDRLPYQHQLEKLGFMPTIYSPAWQLVNDTMVRQLHDKHIRVIPWTVNDSATASSMRALGVDGIITDYPDRIR